MSPTRALRAPLCGVGDAELEVGGYSIAWFVTTLLAIYSHYFAFFILAAENVFLLWRWFATKRSRPPIDRRATNTKPASAGYTQPSVDSFVNSAREFIRGRGRVWFAAQLLLVLCYLPWVREQFNYLTSRANARVSTLTLMAVWDVISKSLGALFIGTTIDGGLQVLCASLCLLLAFVGYIENLHPESVAGRKSQTCPERSRRIANLLMPSVILPILGAIAVNPLLPFFRERFLLISSPAFIILMAFGIWDLEFGVSRILHPASRILFPSICLISLIALLNYWFVPQYHKGEYDLAIAAIRANVQTNDAVVIYSPTQDAVYDYYRMDELTSYALPKANLDAISQQHPRAWLLLYGDSAVYDPNHAAEIFLAEHGFKSFYRSYRDGALARYDFTRGDNVVTNHPIQFGDAITLTGYALPSAVTRGGTLAVTLQWQTRAPLVENYTVFAHLLGSDGMVVAQMDTQPVGGTRPTKTWQVGETVRDNIGVSVPRDAPPGRYQVEVGMYLLQTLKRVEVRDSGGLRVLDDAVVIGEVEIK